MKKRILSYLVVTTMIFALLSSFSFTANASDSTTNKYTYIRMAPYWTAEVVDELTSGYSITILEREYTYLYVQYEKGGEIRRGYMPKADTSATGYSWCQHGVYNSGYNKTNVAQTVYYKIGGEDCGTIDANEGEVSNKPLLVLRTEGNYAFIQYVTNTSNNGSSHVLFKRGWVPTSVIDYNHSTYPTGINQNRYYYIKNVATGKYLDLQSYSAGNVNGGNIHIWDFHGSYNQEWKLLPITSGGSTYVKIATNQGTQNRVIRIAEATAVVGNSAELYTQGNPSKDQEFVFEKGSDGYYQIKARCSGNYMVLGVNPSDSGTGGEVYLRYPDGSDYNKWKIEPASRQDGEYKYWTYKYNSNIADGVSISFDISRILNLKQIGPTKLYLRDYCRDAISSWNYPNSKITVSEDSNSYIKVYWSEDNPKNQEGQPRFATTTPTVDLFNITMFYGNFEQYFIDQGKVDEVPLLWKVAFAHEIGHTLGLDHPPDSNEEETIMFLLGDQKRADYPTKVDISAVKKNYSTK